LLYHLRVLVKKIFSGKYKYLKLSLYIVFISFFYSIFIIEENVYFYKYSYFTTLSYLTAFHLGPATLLLILGYLLIDRHNESVLTAKVIIFITGICIISKISYVLFPKYFIGAKFHIYNISLIKVYFDNKFDAFSLYNFWWLYIAILIIALSNISFSHIGFNKKWNRETIIFTSFFACYIILSCVLNNNFKYQQLMTEKFVWNFLSSIYSSLRVSFLEEALFRGIIQAYFCTKLSRIKDGSIIAIFITSLLFGFFHYPFIDKNFSLLFLHGFIYGWIYYKTQNIWSPIFLHGLNNFLVYVFQ
jgi:membrane protease YdiL (CAAX protease family)